MATSRSAAHARHCAPETGQRLAGFADDRRNPSQSRRLEGAAGVVPHYRRVGDVPRKRHTLVKRPGGDGYLAEELIGQEGFAQESALLYHHRSPSAIVSVEPVEDPTAAQFSLDTPVLPRHLRTTALPVGGDPVLGRRRMLGNDDVVLSFVSADEGSDLYRNASGDELVYVHTGRATLETSFGELDLHAADYVVIPAAVTHRWVLAIGSRRPLGVRGAGTRALPRPVPDRAGTVP